VEHIVVIGHRLCGGIKALVTTEEGQGSQYVGTSNNFL
jgi:carbonic anhydrase